LIGFVLAPAAAHLFKAHMGFSLYNMGFTAGIVGTPIVASRPLRNRFLIVVRRRYSTMPAMGP